MTIISLEKKIDQIGIAKSISKEWKGVLSELVATLVLICFGCMSCVPTAASAPHPFLYAALAFGLIVMFNIQIFGHISGAFMNPFVTITAVIWGKISIVVGVAYVLAECAGAIIGYGLLMTLTPMDIAKDSVCVTLPQGINDFQALGIEILLTAALSLVNCSVWDPVNAHNTDSLPLKFGLTIAGLSLVGSPFTGSSMNPARSLGPAVWTNNWKSHWVYWVGPLAGGIVSATLYKYIWLKKPEPKPQVS